MDTTLTFSLIAAAIVAAVFCGWRGMRPADPHRGIRLIPWRPLMVVFFTAALFLLFIFVHTRQG